MFALYNQCVPLHVLKTVFTECIRLHDGEVFSSVLSDGPYAGVIKQTAWVKFVVCYQYIFFAFVK